MSLHRIFPAVLLASSAFSLPSIAQACSGSLHIESQRSGVYTLDRAAIVAQQPTLADCASAELMLTERGHEIPMRVAGDSNGRFTGAARIEWIGKPLHGPASWFDPYSTVNVYILSAAPGTHLRMHEFAATTPAAPPAPLVRRLHLEEQKLLVRLDQSTMKPGDEPDVWLWAKLTHADAQPFSFGFDLPDLVKHDLVGGRGAQSKIADVTVTLNFRGMSNVPLRAGERDKPKDHVVDLTLNGKPLGTLDWDGRNEVSKDVTLPLASLRPTGNTLAMHLHPRRAPVDPRKPDGAKNPIVDVVMFNWAGFTYPVEGDLDVAGSPVESAAATAQPVSIDLRDKGKAPVAFYSSAGEYRASAPAADGRYRLAASVPGVEIFPVVGDAFLKPASIRAVAAEDLRSASGYDYLIVSHPSLIDAIKPLAEFHRQRGMKVAVIDVDDIYDQFNAGIIHPSAIRNLIAWGTTHWSTKPRYVLLVGTASFDIRHGASSAYNESQVIYPSTGTGKVQRTDTALLDELPHPEKIPPDRNLIPTWQYPSPEGQSASDNHYVALDKDDYHPELAIGRFPVVTPAEVAGIVKKTIDYASRPAPGAWRSKVMFITNEDEYFQKASTEIAETIEQQGFTAEKIYANASEKNNIVHQADIKSDLDAGSLLVHFLGHGGRFIWRSGPPDLKKNHDLFTLEDVSKLSNGDRLPMVLSMTCYSGSFDNPNSDTIGERFLREPDKGAIAVFAASWRNSPNPANSKRLVNELLKPGQTIGDAIVATKAKSKDRVLVETYNLFGDPALVLDRPLGKIALAREKGDRWHDRIAVRLPDTGFDGKVTVSWLDDKANTLQSHTYAASESQFLLPVPSKDVAQVNVYAADARTGSNALGNLDLRPPPPPAEPVAAAKPESKPVPKTAVPSTPRARRSDLPDNIARLDFDSAKAVSTAAKSSAAPVRPTGASGSQAASDK